MSDEILLGKSMFDIMTRDGTTRKYKKYSHITNESFRSILRQTSRYRMYRDKLIELHMAAYEWHNLPETMNVRKLEMDLLTHGKAIVATHKDTGDVCNFIHGASKGQMDIYGEPVVITLMGYNYHDTKLVDDIVIVRNNYLGSSSLSLIEEVALELAEIDMIIAQNRSAQSSPVMITGPEEKKKDILQVYQARGSYIPAIVGDSTLADDVEIKVQPTSADYILDKLDVHKHNVWNQAMTLMGIDNANQHKEERMITGEVEANNSQVNLFRESALDQREAAAREMNEKFGLNVSIEYNKDAADELDEQIAIAKLHKILAEAEEAEAKAMESEALAVDIEKGEGEE